MPALSAHVMYAVNRRGRPNPSIQASWPDTSISTRMTLRGHEPLPCLGCCRKIDLSWSLVPHSRLTTHSCCYCLSGAGWEDTMLRARGGCVILFFALLQMRLPRPAALVVNGTVERSSVWLTSCRRDADCPSRRMACNAGWHVPAGGSVCRCYAWLYTSEAPRCKTLNAVRNDLMTCTTPAQHRFAQARSCHQGSFCPMVTSMECRALLEAK